jgi:nucleoside-diphosphate-sugar epimerase
MPTKTIVITGSSGYLGSKLIASLGNSSNKNIIGLDIKNADLNLDLLNRISLKSASRNFTQVELVHLAGQLPGTDSSKNLMQNSLNVVRNLIEILNPKRTLFLSSTAVYPTENNTHSLEPKPWEAYGYSKLAVENYLFNNTANYSIFRSGTMFDRSRKGGIQKLLTSALNGKPTLIPKKGVVRHPFVSTSDVVKSILFWIENSDFLERSFSDLVASDPVTISELIFENSDSNPKLFSLPGVARKIGSDNFPIFGISKWHINALYYDIADQLKVSYPLQMKPMLSLFDPIQQMN